ncbi:MAG: universal stress protein [Nitrosopumilus sp.]|nr:universal stress protein [Nitrosopumilus sp.]MDH3853497.1 universal stress protein [Nitrosopumilus sp.]
MKIRLKMIKPTRKNNFRLSKRQIQNILVPLDGSKFSLHALNYAINLAKFTSSKITVIFVIPADVSSVPLDDLFDPLSSIEPRGYKAKMTKQGQKILDQAEDRCLQNKIRFTGSILWGNPGYDIVRFAENKKNGIGLIIMGSRGQGHAGEILLGSVSYNVVHKSKKPVMIIK